MHGGGFANGGFVLRLGDDERELAGEGDAERDEMPWGNNLPGRTTKCCSVGSWVDGASEIGDGVVLGAPLEGIVHDDDSGRRGSNFIGT